MKARWHVLGARPLGLFYYSSDSRGLKSLETHALQMTLLSPQCFWVDDQGIVRGEMPAQQAEIARRAKLPVMPLVANPGFDQVGEEDPKFWTLQAPALRSGPQNARSGAGPRPASTAWPNDARLP